MAVEVVSPPARSPTTGYPLSHRSESILLVTVILGFVVVIGALSGLAHYQPLTFDGTTNAQLLTASGAPAVNRADLLLFGPQDQWIIPDGHSTLWFATSFTNTAPFSITVTGFQAPFAGWTGFGLASGYTHSVREGALMGGRPFHPFTLASHASRILTIATPVTCRPLGGSRGEASTLIVDIDVLGVSHQVTLPTTDVGVAYPSTC